MENHCEDQRGNQLKGTIVDVVKRSTTSHVQIDIGGAILMASITNGIAVGDLSDGDAAVNRRLQVDVIGADAGRQRQLSLGALAMRSAVR